jgi:hypothetical protein
MITLNHAFLTQLGLGDLPPERSERLLQHIHETLEMRVGMRLASQMSEVQLDEFEEFMEEGDETGALRWLETNFPDYRTDVKEEFERLRADLIANADALLAAS